jgi:hypothetical protein
MMSRPNLTRQTDRSTAGAAWEDRAADILRNPAAPTQAPKVRKFKTRKR